MQQNGAGVRKLDAPFGILVYENPEVDGVFRHELGAIGELAAPTQISMSRRR